jgi:thiosulfate reductase cytochrome b subunit
MLRIEKKHSLATRWFHWLNFPLLSLMVVSGLLIYWANPVYRIGAGGYTLVRMNVSQAAWKSLHVDHRLALGMAWHFFFMWLFAVNGVLYVIYTLASGEWRELVPNRSTARDAFQVLLHDLHLSRKAPAPAKFNGAQKIAYTMVVVMGLLSVLTGIAIYKPVQARWLTATSGGYQTARFVHFWLTVGYCGFFMVHIAQVIRAGWNNFRAMVTGSEIVRHPRAVAAAHLDGAPPPARSDEVPE